MTKNIQFIVNSEGQKTAVIIPIGDYEALQKRHGEPKSVRDDLEELRLTARTYQILRTEGIHSIEQLSKMTGRELLGIKYFGKKAFTEVKQELSKRGVEIINDLF
jgi:DNA-directed RNA polymerase alpha subunit